MKIQAVKLAGGATLINATCMGQTLQPKSILYHIDGMGDDHLPQPCGKLNED
jgi:hypothetical protein